MGDECAAKSVEPCSKNTLTLSQFADVEKQEFDWGWIACTMNDQIDPRATMTFGVVYFKPNQTNTLHKHPNSDEILHVVEGKLEQGIGGDKWVKMRPGDSILFPLNFPLWLKEGFGPSVHKRSQKANRGILALKAMAHQKWPESMKQEERPWKKTWYEPFDDIDKVSLGLRFTSHLPAHAMIPPGQWDLFKMAVELAQSGALTPLNENEREIIRVIAMDSEPIFTKKA